MAVKLSTLQVPKFNRGGGRRIPAKPHKDDLKAQNVFSDAENKEILDEVHDLFDSTYSVTLPGPWKRAFRPSGFPYCPVIDALSVNETNNYAKAFYLDIGTAVHALMQDYISRSHLGMQQVFANWKCTKCNHLHVFTTLPYACANCETDNQFLQYEEIEVHDVVSIPGGHIDLLIKTKRGWIVCDWKTASTMGLDYRNEADGKHHHQLQAYCAAIQKMYKHLLQGLPVIGYMLIFVPRDNSGARDGQGSNWTPYLYKWTPAMYKQTKTRLFVGRASFEAASIGYETNNWLPAAYMRPCTSLADFGKPMGMRDAFYKGEMCPNLGVCSRSSQDVADFIVEKRATRISFEKLEAEHFNKKKNDYLESIRIGIMPPSLIKELDAAKKSNDYDHEEVQALLALKHSIEALFSLRKKALREKSKEFFTKSPPS